MPAKKPFLVWDQTAMTEDYIKDVMSPEEKEGVSDTEVFNAANSQIDWDFEWKDMCNSLTEEMKKRGNAQMFWKAEVQNFGWRRLNGHKTFKARDGAKLLGEILPSCDCKFRIFKEGRKGFAIQNSHHDSPCGNEWYYVEPAKEE